MFFVALIELSKTQIVQTTRTWTLGHTFFIGTYTYIYTVTFPYLLSSCYYRNDKGLRASGHDDNLMDICNPISMDEVTYAIRFYKLRFDPDC